MKSSYRLLMLFFCTLFFSTFIYSISYDEYIRNLNPTHYWGFDGNLSDRGFGVLADGSFSGGGGYGSAITANSTNSLQSGTGRVVIPNRADINQGSNLYQNRTTSLWFQVSDLSAPTVVYEQGGGTNNFAVSVGVARNVQFQAADQGCYYLTKFADTLLEANKPYHIVATWQRGTQTVSGDTEIRVWLNGVEQGTSYDISDSCTDVFPSHTGDNSIGNTNDNLKFYNEGTLPYADSDKNVADFIFFNDVLINESVITELFERGAIEIQQNLTVEDIPASTQVVLLETDGLGGNQTAVFDVQQEAVTQQDLLFVYNVTTYQTVRLVMYQWDKDVYVSENTFSRFPQDLPFFLIDDADQTSTNLTQVQNYDLINTTDQVYDSMKLWKYDNLSLPSYSTYPISKEGEKLVTTYDIILDPLTSNSFAFNGTTIFIKTNTFQDDIETTGIVYYNNGATTNGIVIDATFAVDTAYQVGSDFIRLQSGFERTNLSGLQTLVDEVEFTCTGSGADEFCSYQLGTRRFIVTGNQTIDPDNEQITIESTAPFSAFDVENGGRLTILGNTTTNGFTLYSSSNAITTLRDAGDCCSNYGFRVQSGGYFEMRGGEISTASGISFDSGSIINITSGIIEMEKNSDNQLRMSALNVYIDGLTFNGNDITTIGTYSKFNNYEPQGSRTALGWSVSTPNQEYEVRNYQGANKGNTKDVSLWQGNRVNLTNPEFGSDVIVSGHIPANANAFGFVRIIKEFQMSIVDESGSAVQDAVFFIRDYDNSNRLSYTAEAPNQDFTPDFTYYSVTNSSGETPVIPIISAIGAANSNAPDPVALDYRSKNNDITDTFDIYIWGYNYIPAATPQSLIGLGVTDLSWTLFEDEGITQTNQATVAAYTQVDNLNQLYDLAKLWKINETNIEYPSALEQVIDVSGEYLDLGDFSLVLNQSASEVFAINKTSQVITIRSPELNSTTTYSGVITTGDINVTTTEVVNFIAIENSTITLSFIGVDEGSYLYARYTNGTEIVSQSIPASGDYFYEISKNQNIYYAITDFAKEIEDGTELYNPLGITVNVENKSLDDINRSEAEVLAMTEFGNLDDVYAYLSYYKSTAAGFAHPSIDEFFAQKSGNLLVFNINEVEFTIATPQIVSYTNITDKLTLRANSTISESAYMINVYSPFNITYSGVNTDFTDIGGVTVNNFSGLGVVNITLSNLPSAPSSDVKCYVLDQSSGISYTVNISTLGFYNFTTTPPKYYDFHCDALGYEKNSRTNVLIDGLAHVELDMSLDLLTDVNNNNLYGFGNSTQSSRVNYDRSQNRIFLDSGSQTITYYDFVDGIERVLNEDINLNETIMFELLRDRVEVTNSLLKFAPSNTATADVTIDFVAFDSGTLDFDSPFIQNGGFNIIYPDIATLSDTDFNRNYTLVLDEFRVFDDALSANEIAKLYNDELKFRTVTVDNISINSTTQELTLNLTLPYSITGEDVVYSVYYDRR